MLLLAVGISGCGQGPEQQGDAAIAPPPAPTRPVPEQCALGGQWTAASVRSAAPKPGAYRYDLRGRERVDGGEGWRDLPESMTVFISPAVRQGNRICFSLQRRLRLGLTDTATFVRAGDALFLTELVLEAEDGGTRLRPRPPILAVSPDDVDWRGAFTGLTRGQYVGHALGRRRGILAKRGVTLVGVAITSSYAGDITGTQRSRQWFSDGRAVLAEEQTRYDLNGRQVEYRSALVSRRGVRR